MTIFVKIPSTFNGLIDSESIIQTVATVLKHQGFSSESDLSIVFVDDQEMQDLNRAFRQENSSTDVLAFPAGYVDPDSHHTYLGDVIISFSQAEQQAIHSRHAVNDEIQLLAIHGVLHLLGHDHLEADDKAKMWSAQEQILNQRGIDLLMPG
jgi:probable rRNA maturation factor